MSRPFYSIYSHGFIRAAVVRSPPCAWRIPRSTPSARWGWRGRLPSVARRWRCSPSWGSRPTPTRICSTRTPCWTRRAEALGRLVEGSRELTPVLLVGAPLRFEGKLFNCAVVIYRGQVLGVVPKTYLPNYREFYEKRQFTSGRDAVAREVTLSWRAGAVRQRPRLRGVEHLPASRCTSRSARTSGRRSRPAPTPRWRGATVLANLSASNITSARPNTARRCAPRQSAKCIAAYLYSAAGPGESTTDLAWDGHALIYENNELLAESRALRSRRAADHRRHRPGAAAAGPDAADQLQRRRRRPPRARRALRRVAVRVRGARRRARARAQRRALPLRAAATRRVRDERCYEAYNIQVHGLMKRLAAPGFRRS